jgi:hypothetical protein
MSRVLFHWTTPPGGGIKLERWVLMLATATDGWTGESVLFWRLLFYWCNYAVPLGCYEARDMWIGETGAGYGPTAGQREQHCCRCSRCHLFPMMSSLFVGRFEVMGMWVALAV